MNYLYQLNETLKQKKIFIYGDDIHATLFASHLISNNIDYEGFVILDSHKESDVFILNKPVLSIEDICQIDNYAILITNSNWLPIYDQLYAFVEPSKIYTINSFWKNSSASCIVCNHEHTLSTIAIFNSFLIERMFNNQNIPTEFIHCPQCGIFYSSYRPTDSEMDLLYSNYRDETYQKMRQRHEPWYTKEFNESLFNPPDKGAIRKNRISSFIEGSFDFSQTSNILDFGGDKGQFIPDIFSNSNKYVYEISGTYVIDGVMLITDKANLKQLQWDVILCNMVMEHLSDIRSYFAELTSYMHSGTILYIEVPYEDYMHSIELPIIHEHINAFREKTFYYLAKDFGCSVVKSDICKSPNNEVAIRVLIKKL